VIDGLDRNTYAPVNPQRAALVRDKQQGPSLSNEKAMLVREQRRALEFRNAAHSFEYFRASVVEKCWNEHFLITREMVLGWPHPVADATTACGCDRAMAFLILEEKIRELLEHMADPLNYERASPSSRTISARDDVELPQETEQAE
jgi:hypothetical protein